MPQISDRVQTFTDSVIRRMTRISDEYGAINLSQGFPDFDRQKRFWIGWLRLPMRDLTNIR